MDSKKEWKVRQPEILKLLKWGKDGMPGQWTSIIRADHAIGATPTTIHDPMSGGMYDPDAEKSLGRYIGTEEDGHRFYSKETTSGIKKTIQSRPHKDGKKYMVADEYKTRRQKILDRRAYRQPWDGVEAIVGESHPHHCGTSYSKDIIEVAYEGYDHDKQERYLDTRWAQYRKLTEQEKYEKEQLESGDYGYVEEDY